MKIYNEQCGVLCCLVCVIHGQDARLVKKCILREAHKLISVFTKSAGLLDKTGKILFCLTKNFIPDKCLAKNIKITMVSIEMSYKIGLCPAKNCNLPDSYPAAGKRFCEDCQISLVFYIFCFPCHIWT